MNAKIIIVLIACFFIFDSSFVYSQTNLFSVSMAKNVSVLNKIVSKGELLSPKLNEVEELYKSAKDSVDLLIPFEGDNMLIKLRKSSVTTSGFQVVESDGNGKERVVNYEIPHTYIGTIDGKTNSTASFTVFKNKIIGMLADPVSNIIINPLTDSIESDYLIYRDVNLKEKLPFKCHTDDIVAKPETPTIGQSFVKKVTSVGRPLGVYFECDYKMFQDFGYNTASIVNYVIAFFSQVSIIYQNENIIIQVSKIKVWTLPDPETLLTETSPMLLSFSNRLGRNFPGDFAHFLSTKAIGGGVAEIPYTNIQCDKNSRHAVSGIYGIFFNFPAYSWTVYVVTHELGHNLSSPHTHWCDWPGGPIDGCGPTVDPKYKEGACINGPIPYINGGTIMSYCHLLNGVGINFLNGFGPLPGQKIRDFVAQIDCPVNCELTATISKDDAACGRNYGTATILATGAQGTITYLWSTGQSNVSTVNLFPGLYYVTATDGAGCNVTKNIEIKSVPVGLTSSVSITSTVYGTICTGSPITFTATAINGGTIPGYQWKVNGVNVGTNSATYTTNSLNNGDVVSVVMTSNASCITTPVVSSNTITAQILTNITPTAAITVNPTGTQCAGTSRTFSVNTNVSNGSYQWYVNGNVAGNNSNTYTTNGLLNNDQVSVRVNTPTGGCYNATNVLSNPIAVQYISNVTPTVSINPSYVGGLCEGSEIIFTANAVNGGSSPSYQWKVNGINVGLNSSSFGTTSLKNDDVVSVVMTPTPGGCYTTTTTWWNTNKVQIIQPLTPSVTINSLQGNVIFAGNYVSFTATVVNGGTNLTYQWKVNGINAGSNSNIFNTNSLKTGDVVSVVITTGAGCFATPTATSNAITMNVKTALTVNNYTVKAIDESCRDKNDGHIDIAVASAIGYTVTVTGNGVNLSQHLTGNNYSFTNLSAGTYQVCLIPDGMSSYYKTCFNAVINEPKDLAVYPRANSETSITLEMAGSNIYFISLNGKDYIAYTDTITLPVFSGANSLTVKTEKSCQGTYTNTFIVGNSLLLAFPNPTVGKIALYIGGTNDKVSIHVFSASGRHLLSQSAAIPQSRLVNLDLSNVSSGIYFIKVKGKGMNDVIKVIKQ